MKNINIEYKCDICEADAESDNWYKVILAFVDPMVLEMSIRVVDGCNKEVHLCKDCRKIVGNFLDLIRK